MERRLFGSDRFRITPAQAAKFGAELLANFVLPYAIYALAQPHLGDVRALLLASSPPLVWTLIGFLRDRQLDVLSLFVLGGIVLSLLAFIGGGSVRLLQLRENLVGGLIALVFLGSAAIGRPLIYELARAGMKRKSDHDLARFEGLRDNPRFRRSMTLMTVVWGLGLLAQTALACILVFSMSIRAYLLISPLVGYGGMALLAGWTYWFARRARRGRLAAEGDNETINPPVSQS
jgi:hypothetical protein